MERAETKRRRYRPGRIERLEERTVFSNGNGLEFLFNYTATAAAVPDLVAAFDRAAASWISYYKDDITVVIDVDYQPLSQDVLGSTDPVFLSHQAYSTVRDHLIDDAVTTFDEQAIANISEEDTFDLLINYTSNNPHGFGSSIWYLDSNDGPNNSNVWMTRANAKAIELKPDSTEISDGTMTFNSVFDFDGDGMVDWDFDNSDGVDAGTWDFESVVLHEIGHIMGFTSGLGVLDSFAGGAITPEDDAFTRVHMLDLFRYSDESGSAIDWTVDTRTKFLSIDGGQTSLGEFSTGVEHGDGEQPAHWKELPLNVPTIGMMAPNLSSGMSDTFSTVDLVAFDAIGWDLLPGDVNGDFVVDTQDIDLLYDAVHGRLSEVGDFFDLNDDESVNQADVDMLVLQILDTVYGDINLDGVFNSTDLVLAYQSGQYEDGISGNSGWVDGDWNGNGEFDSSDLVFASPYYQP